MAKTTKKRTTKKEKPVDLAIDWNIPDNITTGFATNIVIQTIENEFRLLFFELKHDIIVSDKDREEMLQRGTVRADCIASIIITPDRMHKYIDAMTQQLAQYNASKEEKKEN